MTYLGTRPPLISETNLYELHHRARLAIKPGITGMWQVSGRSDITDFEEVVRLDNQRSLLVNFITDREDMSDEYIEYVDDGYSGTNFERPAFKKMIEDRSIQKTGNMVLAWNSSKQTGSIS